jgi:hypothetical protein
LTISFSESSKASNNSSANSISITHPSINNSKLSKINRRTIADLSSLASKPQEPEPKQGWLWKYSREGLLRNWKYRYFTLILGKINYYEKEVANLVGSDWKVKIESTPDKKNLRII